MSFIGNTNNMASERPLEEEKRDILRTVKDPLVKDMDPRAVLRKMSASLLFSSDDEEEINAKTTRQRQNEELLRILPTKGFQAYNTLKKALTESGQEHLANLLEKAGK